MGDHLEEVRASFYRHHGLALPPMPAGAPGAVPGSLGKWWNPPIALVLRGCAAPTIEERLRHRIAELEEEKASLDAKVYRARLEKEREASGNPWW